MGLFTGVVRTRVADPYHFETDPGSEKLFYGSGSRPNFDSDPDPDNKGFRTRKSGKI